MKRRVCIITQKEEELRHFILYELHSGATIYEAIGAYTLEKHNEIITIVDKTEYQKLMKYINKVDPRRLSQSTTFPICGISQKFSTHSI